MKKYAFLIFTAMVILMTQSGYANGNNVNPAPAKVRCLIDVKGVADKAGSIFNLTGYRYNEGSGIFIDLDKETITIKNAGLYHLEGSFMVYFLDDSPHEVFADVTINGKLLEPLDYKVAPANKVGYSSTGLKFNNDIYFTAGTVLKLTCRTGGLKAINGFFSVNQLD